MNLDPYNRRIDYLRVSITNRCNLRCFYCMPARGVTLSEHADILSYEELTRVITAALKIGIMKIRLTGGEPLVRRNLCQFIRILTAMPGILDLGLTTNGTRLKEMAAGLFDAGLRRINISLDTMNPLKFVKITRRHHFNDVMEGITEAASIGFDPIKLNVVVIKGVNDDELEQFARLTLEKPYWVRFIEYMPVGHRNDWQTSKFISARTIRHRLAASFPLFPVLGASLDGPSHRFRLEGARGEIGFIGAFSNHFCDSCNRLRLTPDGKLRPCLFSETEVDLKGPLRDGCSQSDLIHLLLEAIALKPKSHGLAHGHVHACMRHMFSIGG